MNMGLYAALGIGSVLAVGMQPSRPAAATASPIPADSVALASKLPGHWSGTRFDSSSAAGHRFTMDWKKDSLGALTGTVAMADGSSWPTRVVWTSDTGFITESAPHRSAALGEKVVTRTLSHLTGDSLSGTFELRPMSYKGQSERGRFSAHKG
jgi:hypothetical protein